MAGLDRKKTGTNQTSWEFYIEGNPEWLKNPLRTDRDGDLVGPDGVTVAYRFKKNESCQIMDLGLHRLGGKELAKVKVNDIVGWTQIKNISKPTTIKLTSATGERVQERQERAVIEAINEAVAANCGRPILVAGLNNTGIENVIGAKKNNGKNGYGKERYADMILTTTRGEIGVSMKMERAPSLLGGGYDALYDMDPNFITKLMNRALDMALQSKDFELGSSTKLRDIFIELTNKRFLRDAFRGTEKMGGPVDYMFVGKENPKYELEGDYLHFKDSSFYTIDQYMMKVPRLYFRIRRRDAQQIFTNERDKRGVPYFFKKKNGLERARIMVDQTVSGRALVVPGH